MKKELNMLFGPSEPGIIEIDNELEKSYWCIEFGCTEEELIIAVNEVGPKVSKIHQFLSLIRKTRNM